MFRRIVVGIDGSPTAGAALAQAIALAEQDLRDEAEGFLHDAGDATAGVTAETTTAAMRRPRPSSTPRNASTPI